MQRNPREQQQEISHGAHATERERERERESAIGLESDRQSFFLWRNSAPQKIQCQKGLKKKFCLATKKKGKVAVFCGEKKSGVAIFRE
jgi:hypothetical protein